MATYSRVGLRDVVFAKLTADTSSALTYDALEAETLDAIDVSISHANADPNILYADDVEDDILYEDTELTVTLEVKDLPLSLQADLLGMTLGTKSEVIEVAGATIPYYAMGFKSEKRSGNDRYVWLVKGRANPPDDTFHTKEKSITRQNDKITMTFIKRTNDSVFKWILDSEDIPIAKNPASFFTAPYAGTLVDL
ncbi:MAG: major tail protein [Christensenellales bacterium]